MRTWSEKEDTFPTASPLNGHTFISYVDLSLHHPTPFVPRPMRIHIVILSEPNGSNLLAPAQFH